MTTGCPSSLGICPGCSGNLRFVSHSSWALMCHRDNPAIASVWFISANQQHSVCTCIIEYSEREKCSLVPEELSKLWRTKRHWRSLENFSMHEDSINMILFLLRMWWLATCCQLWVCFLCVITFLFLVVKADSSQMLEEEVNSTCCTLQSRHFELIQRWAGQWDHWSTEPLTLPVGILVVFSLQHSFGAGGVGVCLL